MCVCVCECVAMQKPVLALCMLDDGTLLSGGGAEIKAWDSMNCFKRVKERSVRAPSRLSTVSVAR